MQDPKKLVLPMLRSDLLVFETTATSSGEPRWQIYDAIRNQYFLIGFVAYNFYKYWHKAKTVEDLQNIVNEKTVLKPNTDTIVEFIVFLQKANLIIANSAAAMKSLNDMYQKTKSSLLKSLIHNYLFFRIPLLKPDKFLNATYPLIKFLFTKKCLYFFIALFAVSIYLVFAQFENYINTFIHFFNLKGFLYYFLMLAIVKIAHEFGHAYTAKHYKCEIPEMGLAFLVMWPVLYTDTTSIWRLKSKRKRLIVNGAGIIVETAIAIISLFVWSFLDEGVFKSIAFFITTVTWFGTIFVNINCFMRFDGYYLLSDAIEVENLQQRSFNLAKAYLRKFLFGYDTEIDKSIPVSKHRFLILFAFGVWIYRFFLFLGIALLVYHFAFKVLGIFLFLVEIIFFILRPIFNELKIWYMRKKDIKINKATIRTSIILLIITFLLVFPWQTRITIDGVLEYKNIALIQNYTKSRLDNIFVINNQNVKKGDALISLDSALLQAQKKLAEIEVRKASLLSNRSYVDDNNLSFVQVNSSIKNRSLTKLEAINQQINQLIIEAPFDGEVIVIDPYLQKGDWLSSNTPILYVMDKSDLIVYSYIEEKYLDLIKTDKAVTFYRKNSLTNSIKLKIISIDKVNVQNLEHLELASIYGGNIAVKPLAQNQFTPVKTIYKISFQPVNDKKIKGRVSDLGMIPIKTERISIISSIFKLFVGVLIRETGF